MPTAPQSNPSPPNPVAPLGPGARKASILLLALGADAAREIFTRLSEEEIRVLGAAAGQLDLVAPTEVQAVLGEFKAHIDGVAFPTAGAGRVLELMLEKSLGEERTRHLLQSQPSNDPFAICASVDPGVLAEELRNEHAQTIAIVVSSLPALHASKVMQALGAELSGEVVYRMARLGHVSDDVRTDVGNTVVTELKAKGGLSRRRPDDTDKLAVEVTKGLPVNFTDEMLDHIARTEPAFAAEIRSKLFVFDDLSKLDARAMQRLLRELDQKQLIIALKGASDALKQLVMASMSTRAADLLRDDMQAMPPVRIADIQEAQAAVLAVAFRLETQGTLTLPRGDSSDLV